MPCRGSGAAPAAPLVGVRAALIYDCLYPLTVGGGERWYRVLAETLDQAGASVTYLTRRQWDGDAPHLPGIDVVAVSRRDDLYDERGVRRLGPGLRFGAGVFRYLIRHRGDFDVVQLANFPFWSLIAARMALAGSGVPLIVDWHEVWSLKFWRAYAGLPIGVAGYGVQRLCIALTTFALVSSPSNAGRLIAAGMRQKPVVIAGYLPPVDDDEREGEADPTTPTRPPYVLFAGRHIYDKGIDLLPGLAGELARHLPQVTLVIAGDGPGRPGLEVALAASPSPGRTRLLGFVSDEALKILMAEAACVVVPSRREGYGMVVGEATCHGTPVVVADFEENLASEHIEEGRNGYVASPPTPERLAQQVVRAIGGGMDLRASTRGWYSEAARTRTIDRSLRQAVASYQQLLRDRPAAASGLRRSP